MRAHGQVTARGPQMYDYVKFAAWRTYNGACGAEIEAWIASRGARNGQFEDLA